MVIINKSSVGVMVEDKIVRPGEKIKIKARRFGRINIYSKIGACIITFSYGKIEIEKQGRLTARKRLFGIIVVE